MHRFLRHGMRGGGGGCEHESRSGRPGAQFGHEAECDLDFAHAHRVDHDAPGSVGEFPGDIFLVNSETLHEAGGITSAPPHPEKEARQEEEVADHEQYVIGKPDNSFHHFSSISIRCEKNQDNQFVQ